MAARKRERAGGGSGRVGYGLAAGAVLLLAGGCAHERPLPPGLGDRVENHDFRVIASTEAALPAGADVDLKGFRGRPVVVDFWASWCGPCGRAHEGMIELRDRYGDRVALLGVSFQDAPEDATRWLTEHGSNFPAVEDVDGRLAHTFWVNAIPRILVLDPDGRLVDDVLPSFDFPDDVAVRLDSLLAATRGNESPDRL